MSFSTHFLTSSALYYIHSSSCPPLRLACHFYTPFLFRFLSLDHSLSPLLLRSFSAPLSSAPSLLLLIPLAPFPSFVLLLLICPVPRSHFPATPYEQQKVKVVDLAPLASQTEGYGVSLCGVTHIKGDFEAHRLDIKK